MYENKHGNQNNSCGTWVSEKFLSMMQSRRKKSANYLIKNLQPAQINVQHLRQMANNAIYNGFLLIIKKYNFSASEFYG